MIRLFIFLSLILFSCHTRDEVTNPLFELLSPDETNILFRNDLRFSQEFNIYTYRNFYNGGGVALGDINNDGLLDIYLTSNQGRNALYLNKGNLEFEDITNKSGVGGNKAWSTGVSMADVNGDGWIDIYVCNSGDVTGDNKENELFINNKDLTFTEQAHEFGIADRGFTTHAAFLDFDRDNDLDLYILNNSYQAIGSFNLRKYERPVRDSLGGDKFFRNDKGRFVDISEEAGIYGSIIGFGLGVTVGDVNLDGWPDIYVSNDFFERDYLYINNKDGTFKECLTEQMKSISGASMGADLADVNNDGYPDIFVTEMLPADNNRVKTVTTFENWDRYQYNVSNGYYHQFTRNMLQLNNGSNTFSEVGRLAKVEATDWSWGALMFDMDNDGLKDIFVANGIYQDLTNQDYLQYVSSEEVVKSIVTNRNVDYKKLVELIPSNPVSNFAFQNLGDLEFSNRAKEWGLGAPGFSNGAAYGDLDNDGDMDLVVNNVNDLVSIFKNNTTQFFPENHYLKFELVGEGQNLFALGASISVYSGNQQFYVEQMPNRGFESSMDPRPHLGLGSIKVIDSLIVKWPNGTQSKLAEVPANQSLKLFQKDGNSLQQTRAGNSKSLLSETELMGLEFNHTESNFVDFDRNKLLFHMISNEGPKLAVADVNGDGLDDLYIGNAKDQPGELYIQNAMGSFKKSNQNGFVDDKDSEDLVCLFFDADGDKDQDLYVCSGSNEFSTSSFALSDRLYFNDGKGNFSRSQQILPTPVFESTSVVTPADFDMDGDIDLFVGVRSHPFLYGLPVNGYLLQNDGKGTFTDVTSSFAPQLIEIGMITDAGWIDVNADGWQDLIVVGEYMRITLLINNKGKFEDKSEAWGLSKTNGWWNAIEIADLDGDGDLDAVVGNHGLNSRFRASPERPVTMQVNDFDRNGTNEQIISVYQGDVSYPMVLRHDLMSQVPVLKKKFLKYESFKDQTFETIFTPEERQGSLELKVYELASVVLINSGKSFELKKLPTEAQFAPIYAISISDIDGDEIMDLVVGGNLYKAKPEAGRYDASNGLLLKGTGAGNFKALSAGQSGLFLDGEVRDLK
ncbi:MAG TPA: hypothetical protein DHV26_11535, partial [Cytophagales bacterium]|nr:hypothetical protein [Cytophagales bacterium]